MPRIRIRPVGVVKALGEGGLSRIEVFEKYEPALLGMESFSHLWILYWMHELPKGERNLLRIHPRGRLDLPLVGVFASRSRARPNPIGLTLVELVERSGRELIVKGLDALDGTPVIDIKPYVPRSDRALGARVPDWARRLNAGRRRRGDGH
ncbi:MAG: tRNA (N6-threonylcarbamoyladenosine(37)-N6)-methyltransferase TrmO [Candidatus Bathyarchaeia archaeon]